MIRKRIICWNCHGYKIINNIACDVCKELGTIKMIFKDLKDYQDYIYMEHQYNLENKIK